MDVLPYATPHPTGTLFKLQLAIARPFRPARSSAHITRGSGRPAAAQSIGKSAESLPTEHGTRTNVLLQPRWVARDETIQRSRLGAPLGALATAIRVARIQPQTRDVDEHVA